MNEPELEKFENWLINNGAEIVPPTNQYEVLRFRCAHGTGVIYTGKRGYSVNGPIAEDAWRAYKSGKKWRAKNKPTMRKKPKGRKADLIRRDGLNCFFCGLEFSPHLLTIEHVVSLNVGGPDRVENMVLACEPCNFEAGTKNVMQKVKLRESKQCT